MKNLPPSVAGRAARRRDTLPALRPGQTEYVDDQSCGGAGSDGGQPRIVGIGGGEAFPFRFPLFLGEYGGNRNGNTKRGSDEESFEEGVTCTSDSRDREGDLLGGKAVDRGLGAEPEEPIPSAVGRVDRRLSQPLEAGLGGGNREHPQTSQAEPSERSLVSKPRQVPPVLGGHSLDADGVSITLDKKGGGLTGDAKDGQGIRDEGHSLWESGGGNVTHRRDLLPRRLEAVEDEGSLLCEQLEHDTELIPPEIMGEGVPAAVRMDHLYRSSFVGNAKEVAAEAGQ